MTSTDTPLKWCTTTGRSRYADVDGYRIGEILAGRCYVVEQLGEDGLPAASIGETPDTLAGALDLAASHRAETLPKLSFVEWATGHLERCTRELTALGDAATPAARAIIGSNIAPMQAAIRRDKELTAAGHLWCVTTGTGQHLVVPHGPRDNGGFGPVTVWTGWGFATVRARSRRHPSGCLHT